MSLVGTRPILPDELEQYELHHRARIAIKPGITGMWQVSGRSDITDFEEIVRLDTELYNGNDVSDGFNKVLKKELKSVFISLFGYSWDLDKRLYLRYEYIDIHDEQIPDDVVLHGLKQKDGKFVCRIYGVEDNPKENRL